MKESINIQKKLTAERVITKNSYVLSQKYKNNNINYNKNNNNNYNNIKQNIRLRSLRDPRYN